MTSLRRATASAVVRSVGAAAVVVLVAAGSPQCTDSRAADGAPCTAPFNCASGFCLGRSATVHVCGHVCTTDGDCAAGDVCGRYNFQGLDDAGLPEGDPSDVVSVCRPSTAQTCVQGCGTGGCLSVGTPADGVCAARCVAGTDCFNGLCLTRAGGCAGLCAPPCDSIAECPRYFVCDTIHIDGAGHGRCLPTDPDAGITAIVGAADAACGGDS